MLPVSVHSCATGLEIDSIESHGQGTGFIGKSYKLMSGREEHILGASQHPIKMEQGQTPAGYAVGFFFQWRILLLTALSS